MRKITNAWADSQNHLHLTRADCQLAELTLLLSDASEAFHMEQEQAALAAKIILSRASLALNILNVTDRSRVNARKLNGARRRPRDATTQPQLPNTDPPARTHPF